MSLNDWQSLFNNLTMMLGAEELDESQLLSEGARVIRKPSIEDLEAFEAQHKFKLPVSYREYIMVFGPGILGEEYVIPAPGYPEKGSREDLTKFNFGRARAAFREEEFLREEFPDEMHRDRARRLFFFCDKSGGDMIGWDPLDVRDSSSSEYGIYLIVGEGSLQPIYFIAESFERFVHEFCLGDGYYRLFEPQDEWDQRLIDDLLRKSQVFAPMTERIKKRHA